MVSPFVVGGMGSLFGSERIGIEFGVVALGLLIIRPSMLLALLAIESTRMSSISLTPLSAHSQSSRPTISLLCMLLTLFQNPPFLI